MTAWARHGIWHGVRRLGLGPGDAVLVPSYSHGSEIEALLRTGVRCVFYDLDADLAPRAAELERLCDEDTRALYLTHFLGFPQPSGIWREWCDARGLLLIEDAAQAWLATDDGLPVGARSDLAVYCLYKTFGLPEGAVAYERTALGPAVPLDPRAGLVELARRNGHWLLARSAVAAALRERGRRGPAPASVGPAADFDLRDPTVGPWAHTPFVVRRIADPGAAARRRENYGFLLERLRQHVPRPFGVVPPGASPFAFPIEVEDKPAVIRRLARAGIVALDLWAVSHPAVPAERFPAVARRRARTVALPVHQELRRRDLERIAEASTRAIG
jgi:dTDP-4-amino-4,6-dideoxygalactose transaminase